MRLPQSLYPRPSVNSKIQFSRAEGLVNSTLRTISLILCFYLAAAAVGFAQYSQTADYYVLPTGSDSNPGTLEQPFATFNQARISADALWQKSKGRTSPITVMFRAGTYYLSSTLNFTSADSGSSALGIV